MTMTGFYSGLMMLWPVAFAIVGAMCVYNRAAVGSKLSLFGSCITFALTSRDRKWAKNEQCDPEAFSAAAVQRRTVVFIRHGESTWNESFNKGKNRGALRFALGFLPGLSY